MPPAGADPREHGRDAATRVLVHIRAAHHYLEHGRPTGTEDQHQQRRQQQEDDVDYGRVRQLTAPAVTFAAAPSR